MGKNVSTAAPSGVAAQLLISGMTLHSRFSVPRKLKKEMQLNIEKHSVEAQKIRQLDFIFIDEAPMAHRYIFECIDKDFKDFRNAPNKIFGGVSVILGGDWRQILPVIKGDQRPDSVRATLKRSHLWRNVTEMSLTQNMRLIGNSEQVDQYRQSV